MINNETSAGEVKATTPNHIRLSQKITQAHEVYTHLCDLENSILGSVPPVEVSEEKALHPAEPTLFYLLNEGPEQLKKTLESIHSKISDIQQTLLG